MRNTSRSRKVPSDALSSYVADTILPRLQKKSMPFSLRQTDLGNRNSIAVLQIDRDLMILKGFKRKYRIKNTLLANSFLYRCGVSVPKPLFADLSARTYARLGRYYLCEQKIAGKSLASVADITDAIPRVARFYASLHGIQSSRWGKLASARKYGLMRYLQGRVARWLDALQQHDDRVDATGSTSCAGWFRGNAPSPGDTGLYSLCHGDVNRKNIFLADTGEVYLIDSEAIKYLPFTLEYYRLMNVLCGSDSGLQQAFRESYFRNSPPGRREVLDRCGPWYEAYVLLEFAYYHNRKQQSGRLSEQQRSLHGLQKSHYLSRLDRIMSPG